MGLYLYGLVRTGALSTAPGVPGVAGATVGLFQEGSVTAIVSDLPEVPFRAQRGDLMAHSDVLQEAVGSADVLPMRFGTVFASPTEMVDAFLQPNRDELLALLDRLQGSVEIQVKVEYDADAVACAIVAGDRRIQKLQTRARERDDVQTKIELGRRFAAALDEARYADGRRIVDALSPLAADVALGDAAGEYGVVNASFLVSRGDLARFDDTVAEVRGAVGDSMTIRYLGPLPPYSFVDAGSMVTG